MRVALSATAIALAPVVQTLRPQERRERRLAKRFLDFQDAPLLRSVVSNHKPLWKQANRPLVTGAIPCDPSATISSDEPDVGILAQCPRGSSCQPLSEESEFGAFGGGVCITEDTNLEELRHRHLTTNNTCTYYQDALGFACNCSNCKWQLRCQS
jgi:hypothetical protein